MPHSISSIASGVKDKVDDESGLRHLLLFISALVPKAFAALLTSAVIELSKPENVRIIIICLYINLMQCVCNHRQSGEAAVMMQLWTMYCLRFKDCGLLSLVEEEYAHK